MLVERRLSRFRLVILDKKLLCYLSQRSRLVDKLRQIEQIRSEARRTVPINWEYSSTACVNQWTYLRVDNKSMKLRRILTTLFSTPLYKLARQNIEQRHVSFVRTFFVIHWLMCMTEWPFDRWNSMFSFPRSLFRCSISSTDYYSTRKERERKTSMTFPAVSFAWDNERRRESTSRVIDCSIEMNKEWHLASACPWLVDLVQSDEPIGDIVSWKTMECKNK